MNDERLSNCSEQKPKRSFKAIGCIVCVLAILAMSLVSCFADGAASGSAEAVSAVSTVLQNVTGTINIASVVQILGIGIGACIGMVLMWFGVRLVIRKVMGATRKGKV